MRDAFFDELASAAERDPRIALLTADLGYKLVDRFAQRWPRRFFNMGVSEANMISVAAGLALTGMRPVAYSIVPFATIRCLEQLRNDVCNMELPVVVVGVGGGYAYGVNGPTHHGIDDVAALRSLAGMSVYCPCDPNETRAALRTTIERGKPAYLRLGRNKEPILTAPRARLESGAPTVLRAGERVALLACGPIANEALQAADLLERRGLRAYVLSAHTVKPLDDLVEFVLGLRLEIVFVVEEHGPCGGLADGVAGRLAGLVDAPRVIAITAPDRFLHEVGDQDALRRIAGIDSASICARVEAEVAAAR